MSDQTQFINIVLDIFDLLDKINFKLIIHQITAINENNTINKNKGFNDHNNGDKCGIK